MRTTQVSIMPNVIGESTAASISGMIRGPQSATLEQERSFSRPAATPLPSAAPIGDSQEYQTMGIHDNEFYTRYPNTESKGYMDLLSRNIRMSSAGLDKIFETKTFPYVIRIGGGETKTISGDKLTEINEGMPEDQPPFDKDNTVDYVNWNTDGLPDGSRAILLLGKKLETNPILAITSKLFKKFKNKKDVKYLNLRRNNGGLAYKDATKFSKDTTVATYVRENQAIFGLGNITNRNVNAALIVFEKKDDEDKDKFVEITLTRFLAAIPSTFDAIN